MRQLNSMIAEKIEFSNACVAATGVAVNRIDRLERSIESRLGLQSRDFLSASGAPSRP